MNKIPPGHDLEDEYVPRKGYSKFLKQDIPGNLKVKIKPLKSVKMSDEGLVEMRGEAERYYNPRGYSDRLLKERIDHAFNMPGDIFIKQRLIEMMKSTLKESTQNVKNAREQTYKKLHEMFNENMITKAAEMANEDQRDAVSGHSPRPKHFYPFVYLSMVYFTGMFFLAFWAGIPEFLYPVVCFMAIFFMWQYVKAMKFCDQLTDGIRQLINNNEDMDKLLEKNQKGKEYPKMVCQSCINKALQNPLNKGKKQMGDTTWFTTRFCDICDKQGHVTDPRIFDSPVFL